NISKTAYIAECYMPFRAAAVTPRRPKILSRCRAKEKPGAVRRVLLENRFRGGSGAERLDPPGESRNLARHRIAMQDALAGGAHQFRLRCLQRGFGGGLVAGSQGFLDLAHIAAHARAPV